MADRYIPEHRRTGFKAKTLLAPEVLRRRREEQQVEIRKAKREENLAKRRGIGVGDNRPGASLGAAPDSDDETVTTETQVLYFFTSLFSLILIAIRAHLTMSSMLLLHCEAVVVPLRLSHHSGIINRAQH